MQTEQSSWGRSDGIPGRVLKSCALELTPIFHSLFHRSLCTSTIPVIINCYSRLKNNAFELNHYRPVSLTSIIMKCFEQIVKNIMLPHVTPSLDCLQFAYMQKRGTDDAVACLLHCLLQQLDISGKYARLLFIDFSSPFNSIQRHRMIKNIQSVQVPSSLIYWIHNFLSNRPQVVKVDSTLSPTIVLKTGAPQGCVLSPLLFILYTNDFQSPVTTTTKYFKYADDTAFLALLNEDNDSCELSMFYSTF